MRKITFTILGLLFSVCGLWAQTYSTGTVTFFANYNGRVDVSGSTVTLRLVGPSTSWLGVGFNAPGLMDDIGKDVVIFDGTNMTDRSFNGLGVTPPTDTQNWTVTQNTISAGVRTVVATRSRIGGESTDYNFALAAQPLHLTFARGTSLAVSYHGSGNCGSTTANLTLGIDSFDVDSFKMYPNPAKNFVNIELPQLVTEATITIHDMLGKKVKETTINLENTKVDLSGLVAGSYLMNIKTIDGEGTKTLVIE